jgi:hypothetical protein
LDLIVMKMNEKKTTKKSKIKPSKIAGRDGGTCFDQRRTAMRSDMLPDMPQMRPPGAPNRAVLLLRARRRARAAQRSA